MRKLIAMVAVASLFAWSSPAAAQVSPYRNGWWGSVNIGPGWNSSDNLEGDRLTGGAGVLRAGYALSPNWLVGGEVMGWFRNYLDPRARGPGVPVQSTLFTLLALGILAGGAVRMGRR